MMNNLESAINIAEQKQSAEDFIATIAPMTANSGQINILRELGGLTDQDTILETWCGAGDLTAQLAEIGGRTVGADYSQALIEKAKTRFPHIEFVMSGAEDLPFPDDSFDVVVSNFTAHHYSAPEKNFAEAQRVLKPGGQFLVALPIQSKRVGLKVVLDVAREFLDLPAKAISGGPLHDIETAEEIIAVMRLAQFREFEGHVRTFYTTLESLDTLLNYAWKKIALGQTPQEVQDQIRTRSIKEAQVYLSSDGSYRFPDQVLAVRGVK